MEEFYHELSKSIRKEILIDDLTKTLGEFEESLRHVRHRVRRIPYASYDDKEEMKYLRRMIKSLKDLINWYNINY